MSKNKMSLLLIGCIVLSGIVSVLTLSPPPKTDNFDMVESGLSEGKYIAIKRVFKIDSSTLQTS